MTKNADYEKIAPRYNDARPLHRKDMGYWATLVSETVSPLKKDEINILDLGCGNGRFSILFARELGYKVTGVDGSEAMIRECQNNDTGHAIEWHVENATNLTFPDDSFDVIWISHLLHLVDDPQQVLHECFRLLKPGGVLIDRYSSLEDNLRKPERKLIPELADLDLNIIPPQSQIEDWLREAHFQKIESNHLQIPTYTAEERWERARSRVESGLTKISDSAFERGLLAFRAYIENHPNDRWILDETYTVTTATK